MHPLKECLLCVFKCCTSKLGCFKTNWLAYQRGFVLLVGRQEEHSIHCNFFWELTIDSVQFIFKQAVLLAVPFLFNCVFNMIMIQSKMQFSFLTQLRYKCISSCNLLIWFVSLVCLTVSETSMLQCKIQVCFFCVDRVLTMIWSLYGNWCLSMNLCREKNTTRHSEGWIFKASEKTADETLHLLLIFTWCNYFMRTVISVESLPETYIDIKAEIVDFNFTFT